MAEVPNTSLSAVACFNFKLILNTGLKIQTHSKCFKDILGKKNSLTSMFNVQFLNSNVQCPNSYVQYPNSNVQCPNSNVQCPNSNIQCLKSKL